MEEQRDPGEARMQKPVGEADFRGREARDQGGPSWHPASHALALPLQDIQGFGVLLNVSPEPHEAKHAKLWPRLR